MQSPPWDVVVWSPCPWLGKGIIIYYCWRCYHHHLSVVSLLVTWIQSGVGDGRILSWARVAKKLNQTNNHDLWFNSLKKFSSILTINLCSWDELRMKKNWMSVSLRLINVMGLQRARHNLFYIHRNLLPWATGYAVQLYGANWGPPWISPGPFTLSSPHDLVLGPSPLSSNLYPVLDLISKKSPWLKDHQSIWLSNWGLRLSYKADFFLLALSVRRPFHVPHPTIKRAS